MSSGSMNRIIGPTRPTFGTPSAPLPKPPMPPTGKGPFSMKRAVMKPQAMKAAMFGMIIPERKVPTFCTAILAPDCPAGAVVVALTGFPPMGTDDSAAVGPALPPEVRPLRPKRDQGHSERLVCQHASTESHRNATGDHRPGHHTCVEGWIHVSRGAPAGPGPAGRPARPAERHDRGGAVRRHHRDGAPRPRRPRAGRDAAPGAR